MKKTKRSLLLMIALLAVALCFAIGACGGGTVKLTFVTNGGSAVESMEMAVGEQFTLPVPEREGYSFEGWFTDKELTGSPVTSGTAEQSVTYYAKWKPMARITLELSGGSLEAGTTLYLKEGEDLYRFMQAYQPEAADGDHIFGAWFVGDKELAPNAVMTDEGITLTARYKVKFTVKTYLQTDDGYEQGEDYVGYDYEGVVPGYQIDGYQENPEHEGTVAWHTLKGSAAENVFTIYYDRKMITTSLYSNYPDGSDAEIEEITAPYGAAIQLPTELFAKEGYCLIGWGTSLTSGVVYESSYLYDRLFSKEGVEKPQDYKVEYEQTLYAVWARGYTDMFGGQDIVYHFDENDPVVYINRSGIFLKATYRASNGIFLIQNSANEIVLQGKFSDGYTFNYFDKTRNGSEYALYEGRKVNNNVTIHFDGYNGIEYVQPSDDGVHKDTSAGTFTLTVEGNAVYYLATFTTGKLAGQTLTIRVGYVSGTGDSRVNVFQVRADEDVALGTLYRFVDLDRYYPSVYMLTLNGFGTATMFLGNNSAGYYYEREDDIVTLYSSNDEVAGVLYLAKMGNRNGYYLYDETLDHEFVSATGATLELDGIYSATYTVQGQAAVKGTYNVMPSELGGSIVSFTAEGGTASYRFYLTTTSTQGAEDEEPVYSYGFEVIAESYGEYYYAAEGGIRYTPLLVLDRDGEGKASLYGYPNVRTYTKFADATYIYDEQTGLYAFTITQYYTVEGMTTGFGFDAAQLKSFVCGFLYSSGYSAFYLTSVTLDEQEPTNYSAIYISGKDTLTLVAGFCFYETVSGESGTESTNVVIGTYTISDNILSMTVGETAYTFELNDENKTFERLTQLLGTAYGMTEEGSTDRTQTLVFDGKGGVVYTNTAMDRTVKGTFRVAEDETLLQETYFLFETSDGEDEFAFKLYTTGSSVIFVRYNEELAGNYYSTDEKETLSLDGFAGASYVDAEGRIFTGLYTYEKENRVVIVVIEEGYLYFDLRDEDSFTLRGPEYTSVCLLLDNQTLNTEVLFALDGYGKLTVYDAEGETVDENGSYRNLDGNRYVFTYRDKDGKQQSVYGVLGIVSLGSTRYLAIIVEHDGVVGSYVNEKDFSVLTIDAYGNGVRYSANGVAEQGGYLLVTESILYYFTDSDACIYHYDTSHGVATPVKFTAYGYYTENLEALNFSEYGYVYVEGERCYFTVEDGNVIIYRLAKEGDTEVNAYGFVEDRTFGSFTEAEKNYKGKKYYRSDGYEITFVRAENEKDKYPILTGRNDDEDVYSPLGDLTFSPRGNGEFSANGTIRIGDISSSFNCVVVRNILDDGTPELYLRLNANFGYYRFDIDIEYHGDSTGPGTNVYSIKSMKYIVELPSYNYLYYYYLMYMISGGTSGMQNVFGTLTVTKDCNENGVILEESAYLDLQFGEMMPLTDYNGNPIRLEKEKFTEETTGNINYTVTFKGEDGYDYILRLARTYFSYMRQYGFNIYSLTRIQTFDVELGEGEKGKLEIERVIYSELTGVAPGALWNVRLYNESEELLESESYSYLADGVVHYIVRERDEEEKITATTYYNITLREKVPEEVGDPSADRVQPYTEVELAIEEMTTLYADDGSFADLNEDNEIVLFVIGRTVYLVDECTYNEETGEYLITTTSKRKFKVVKSGETLTFEEITEASAE